MNRIPLIRFFISSTFADMELERNELRNIFSRLKEEYQAQGWQIEYIDLRWGIRSETSMNNQTMRICLKELERCQNLSPQPNFIILLGERYGWIPLPELISEGEMRQLQQLANPEEQAILMNFYAEDTNQLPKYYYLLPKNHNGADPSLFEKQVEKPLRCLMKRYADSLPPDDPAKGRFDHSATAQEIDHGVLMSANPESKTLAFFRTLTDIPHEKQERFSSQNHDDQVRMQRLKDDLHKKLSHDNIYELRNVSYDNYICPHYSNIFRNEMESRLRKFIEVEIDNHPNDDLVYELNEHLEIANNEAIFFVGKELELKRVMHYIKQDEPAAPLWLIADNGLGKTTLMARVTTLCQSMENTVVIPRFCGHTKQSCDSRLLLLYLWKEIRTYFDKSPFNFEPNMYRILFGTENGLFDTDFLISPSENFLYSWKHLTPPNRYVIIIDGLDELEISKTPWLAEMNWLPREPLPANVKVILTSSPCSSFPYEPANIRIEKKWINPLEDNKERSAFLETYLHKLGRTVTESQWASQSWNVALMYGKESTPLNLSLLAHELSQLHSQEKASDYGSSFQRIAETTLNRLMRPQNHGKEMVQMALALIVTSHLGVTDEEMSRVLALDDAFYTQFCNSSFHAWQEADSKERSLPAVLWARLKTDMDFFLTMRNSTAGYYIRFKHKAFEQLITGSLMNEEQLARAEKLWITYFTKQWQKENRHALSELPRLLTERYRRTHQNNHLQPMLNLLSDYRFVMLKQKLLPGEILDDFNRVSSQRELASEVVKRMRLLENEIMSLPQPCDDEEFMYRVANLTDNSQLRQSVKQSGMTFDPPLLTNQLRHVNLNDTVICYYNVEQIGQMPLLIGDGEIVISLYQNCKVSKLFNLQVGTSLQIAESLLPVIYHDIDGSSRLYVTLTTTTCTVRRLEDSSITFSYSLPADTVSKAQFEWCSLSTNGEKLVFGGENIPAYIADLNTNVCHQLNVPLGQSSLSADGCHLWEVNKEYVRRFNTNTWSQQILYFEKVFNHLNIRSEWAGDTRILQGCSNNIACIRMINYVIVVRKNRDNTWWCTTIANPNEPTTRAIIDSQEENVWIFALGGSTIHHNINENSIEIYKTYDIEAINSNMQNALSLERGVLFNYAKQKGRMVQMHVENSGVNTLAADSRGNTLMVSIGKRHTEISGNDLICYKKENTGYIECLIHTPLVQICDYVAGCAFAPNGTHYAYSIHSSVPLGNFVIANWPNNEILHDAICQSFTALQFTSDSRYIVAVAGDYITSSPFVWLHLYTAQGEDLGDYKDQDNYENETAYNILVSPCNRYVLIGDKCDSQIIDLVTRHSFGLKGINTSVFRFNSLDIFPAWAFHPAGRCVYISSNENLYRIELTSRLFNVYPESRRLQCISPCGKYLFMSDTEGNLWKVSSKESSNKIEEKIAKKVWHTIPAVCGEYLYIMNALQEVLLTDYNGKILQKAYFNDCIRYKVTAAGLAIAQADGRVQLFTPLPQYQSHRATVFALSRWNLKDRLIEAPTVVCPVCGEVHKCNTNTLREKVCPNCSTEFIVG